MTVDPFNESSMLAERERFEEQITVKLDALYEKFATKLRDQALAASQTRTLVAVGYRKRDPLAYTNVIAEWRRVIRTLAQEKDQITYGAVADMLLESNIPIEMFEDTVSLLKLSREEEWTEYRTKVELGRLLIPKDSFDPGKNYKAKVRAIARTASTRTNGLRTLNMLTERGVTRKKWVSVEDNRTRDSHEHADGQIVDIAHTFRVGGYSMLYPGDPAAPFEERVNCRCVIVGVRKAPTRLS